MKFYFTSALVAVVLLASWYLYLDHNRYLITPPANGLAYKIDKQTGQTYLIAGNQERLVKVNATQEPATEAERAIDMVSESKVISKGFGYSGVDSERAIHLVLEKVKGPLPLMGWKSREVDDNVFVVGFEIQEQVKVVGWYCEVQTEMEIIRYLNQDISLMQHYGFVAVDYERPAEPPPKQRPVVDVKTQQLYEKYFSDLDRPPSPWKQLISRMIDRNDTSKN